MQGQCSGGRVVKAGIGAIAFALIGWLTTVVVISCGAQPDSAEDLTSVWVAAGPTPLGTSTTVEVPSGATLVAFLVGTDLSSAAGTTTGTCSASAAGEPVELGWPVHIDQSITGLLAEGEQTVPIAGWTNGRPGGSAVTVKIICDTHDSTVHHFVAVSTKTAVVETRPWFQPWGWLALAVFGGALIGVGVFRLRSVID